MGVTCYSNDIKISHQKNPYLESLSIFGKIKYIAEEFPIKLKEKKKTIIDLPPNIESIEDFIEHFKKHYDKSKGRSEMKDQKFVQNPQKIFYFFLGKLHLIFRPNINGNEEEYNETIHAPEYTVSGAKLLFNKIYEKDQSKIKDIFYGKKLIIINCDDCGSTNYLFKYLKLLPLNLGKIHGEMELLDLIKSLENNNNDDNIHCSMCNKKGCNITLKLAKKAKILIILFYNYKQNIKIDVPEYLFEKSYKLIYAEIKFNNTLREFYDTEEKNFILNNEDKKIDMKLISKGEPFVLFYKRKKKELDKTIDFEKDDIDESLISNYNKATEPNEKLNYKNNNNNKNNNKNNNNNINNNKNNNIVRKQDIILFFKFSQNGKEIFLDTDDCKTFSDIIIQLQTKYSWASSIISQNTKFFCNEKEIKLNKTPRELKVRNESKIIIKD